MDDPREIFGRRDEYQIVDVREPYEWDAGHIDGAVHLPLPQVMGGLGTEQFDPARPIVVVCRSGNRSELAALMLQARGFDARNLEGGMDALVRLWGALGEMTADQLRGG